MHKRGVIWVAAVLYIAIGMVVLGLILAAALPAIGKLKDRNVYAQTKELFFVIDKNIRQVVVEGVASQRELNPLTITKGALSIDEDNIQWSMKTEAMIVEPSPADDRIIKKEGNVEIWQEKTAVKGEYALHLDIYYPQDTGQIRLLLDPAGVGMPLQGTYSVLIKNAGVAATGKIDVNILVQ
ncbi:MAG TPA: hypothetical protein VJJ75_00445 [Candidatus Nanoarchaeia archaeon]|nr:hypothetical protein [Candidatus Nanoarchaeia archaeon]